VAAMPGQGTTKKVPGQIIKTKAVTNLGLPAPLYPGRSNNHQLLLVFGLRNRQGFDIIYP